MFDLRLIRADALKLRRRRGLLVLCLLLTLGIEAITYTVAAIQHAGDAARHLPAGGALAFDGSMFVMTMMMLVVGAIVGATAGAQDLESGVFRDLAATGRSRLALFGARIPGACAIVLPIAVLAVAASAIAAAALAAGLPGPDAVAIASGAAVLLTAGALSATVSVGLAALTGSKAPVITAMLAFTLAIAPLLSNVASLGDARMAIPTNALARIGDAHIQNPHMSLGTAIVVVVAWAAAAFGAGAWRTRTREI
ncbi:MAG TPA: hypothetical protein VMY78_10700 [Solirubrobacteraceae bacterium]|nr:hypothetical protein [Solirubrobacteraceae bacterium]